MDELVTLSRPLLAALPLWALKGAALLLVAGLADLFLRSRPAALRHLVWGGTLAGLLAMPLLPGLLPPLAMTVELPAAMASVARARPLPYPEARSAERIRLRRPRSRRRAAPSDPRQRRRRIPGTPGIRPSRRGHERAAGDRPRRHTRSPGARRRPSERPAAADRAGALACRSGHRHPATPQRLPRWLPFLAWGVGAAAVATRFGLSLSPPAGPPSRRPPAGRRLARPRRILRAAARPRPPGAPPRELRHRGADDLGHPAPGRAAARGRRTVARGAAAQRPAARAGARAPRRRARPRRLAARLRPPLVRSAGLAGRAPSPPPRRARVRRPGAARRLAPLALRGSPARGGARAAPRAPFARGDPADGAPAAALRPHRGDPRRGSASGVRSAAPQRRP